MQKIGELDINYQAITMDLSAYPGLTLSDIYLIPHSFTIRNVKDETLTESLIKIMTYEITKTFSNGILTAIRTSVSGDTGIVIHCDVYIYY